ncbi:hypothetical protein KPH14_010826 [Odynerus spinipes]|uniref:Ribosomal protein 63, mitochondrial n=1 Tax=Odynerus spinipes TaxID=1348599 RepID=A0AAD9RH29_9HYME|nr:hypothetical protein KPH14_010826 [Odynerus spinipes]
MKVTARLLREIPYRFRGKNRIVKEPKFIDLLRLRHDFEREERNMLILRHPYLTFEQSHGHMKDLKTINKMKIFEAEKIEKFSKRITIADRLNHLMVSESWD